MASQFDVRAELARIYRRMPSDRIRSILAQGDLSLDEANVARDELAHREAPLPLPLPPSFADSEPDVGKPRPNWIWLVVLLAAFVVMCVLGSLASPRHRGPRRIADVPMAKDILRSALPEDQRLQNVAGKLYALGFPDEANRLLNYPEALPLLRLFAPGTPTPKTVQDAIAMPATSDEGIRQLRDQLLDQLSVRIQDTTGQELPDLKPVIESYGSSATPPEHVRGALWRTNVTDFGNKNVSRALWLVSLLVTQHMDRPVRLDFGLSGPRVAYLRCPTGVLAPGEATTVVCVLSAGPSPNGQLAGDGVPELAAADGALKVISVQMTDPNHHVLAGANRNSGEEMRRAREQVARASAMDVAYASCQQRADCLQTYLAVFTSRGSAGLLAIAVAMIWSARRRWRIELDERRSNPFKRIFAVYLVLVLIAIPIDVLDSRAVMGGAPLFTGLISTAYNMMLAMPWTMFRMSQISTTTGAALVGGAKVDMVLSWIFMLANLAWLWCMANPPAPALRGTKSQRNKGKSVGRGG